MKKFFLAVFVVAISSITLSCGSDDDGDDGDGGVNIETLSVRIDGELITFNSIIVDTYTYTDDGGGTELDVTATIGGSTQRIITFYAYQGTTGANNVFDFTYLRNGVYYSAWQSGTNFTSVITVNNGSRLEVNFSGTLAGYDEESQEEVFVTLDAGSLIVEY